MCGGKFTNSRQFINLRSSSPIFPEPIFQIKPFIKPTISKISSDESQHIIHINPSQLIPRKKISHVKINGEIKNERNYVQIKIFSWRIIYESYRLQDSEISFKWKN